MKMDFCGVCVKTDTHGIAKMKEKPDEQDVAILN